MLFIKPFFYIWNISRIWMMMNTFQLMIDPNIIMTNIANPNESLKFTSKLHHQYEIDKSHIIYIGDQYTIPVTTVRMNQLNNLYQHPQCNFNSYYKDTLLKLYDKDWKQTCIQEQNIANIISALQKSNEKYEIVFDDSFWLEDESIYRLLLDKRIIRILQLDLENDNLYIYPFFTDKTIYYWKHNQMLI